ncbi:MAG: DUF1501 domain-containing protein [Pseudomonadota bacterium]
MTGIINTKRRHFLRQMAGVLSAGGAYATLGQLGMVNQAMAQGGSAGYRALVCIYLTGGNDSFNLLVPRDTTRYNQYSDIRENLAIPREDLLAVSPLSGGNYGFHPSCPGLRSLFNAGDLAVVTNVGPLVAPMTKLTFENGSAPRPPQLFSHNSQTELWQSGSAIAGMAQGWGGLVADQLVTFNANPDLPFSVSVGGNNRFAVGEVTRPYQIGLDGLIEIEGFDTQLAAAARQAGFDEIFAAAYDHPFQREYRDTMTRSIELEALFSSAMAANPVTTSFPDTNLGGQLETVARLIAARGDTGQSRQIFFVSQGGYDTHNSQNTDQPELLTELNDAITAFQSALGDELNVANDVTTFTMSEFGRTLNSNGDGSDHGWGGQQMVIGGGVLGQTLYGTYPEIALDGADSIGRGRMIPSTALDQYCATLAKWLGVGDSELNAIFPNLNEFAAADLGFVL